MLCQCALCALPLWGCHETRLGSVLFCVLAGYVLGTATRPTLYTAFWSFNKNTNHLMRYMGAAYLGLKKWNHDC